MSWVITGSQKVNWDPSLISTALWLDAADSSTVTTVSGAVSQWNDKSGNAKNATQTVSANRPTIGSNLNSKQTLNFNASKTMSYPAVSAGSVFVLARTSNYLSLNGLIGNLVGLNIRMNSATAYRTFAASNSNVDDFTDPLGSTFRINGQVTSSGTLSDWHFISAIRSSAPTTFVDIGGVNAGRPWNGDIAEAIIVTGTLATFETQKIEGYLAHKWGLTASLPIDHPFKVNPPAP